jgi:hypothetical protein
MGTLLHFDISGNNIREEGTQALAAALKGNMAMTQLNMSSNYMTCNANTESGNMAGIIALSDVIKDMGELTSLNLSANYLSGYLENGAKIFADAIKVTKCAVAVVLAPFSCPSDHWLNCCCLLLFTGYRGHIVGKSPPEQHRR